MVDSMFQSLLMVLKLSVAHAQQSSFPIFKSVNLKVNDLWEFRHVIHVSGEWILAGIIAVVDVKSTAATLDPVRLRGYVRTMTLRAMNNEKFIAATGGLRLKSDAAFKNRQAEI